MEQRHVYFAQRVVQYFSLFDMCLAHYEPQFIIKRLKPAFELEGSLYFYLLEENGVSKEQDFAILGNAVDKFYYDYLNSRNRACIANYKMATTDEEFVINYEAYLIPAIEDSLVFKTKAIETAGEADYFIGKMKGYLKHMADYEYNIFK